MNKPFVFGIALTLSLGLFSAGCVAPSYPKTEAAMKQGITFPEEFFCDDFKPLAKANKLPASEPGPNHAITPEAMHITPGDHIGPIAADTTHLKLLQQFGPANVRLGPVHIGEGQCQLGTILFPDTPKQKLEILWEDSPHLAHIATARFSDESHWQLPEGITIGTSLETLEKINGRPFKVVGFDWDYGGYVTNWQGGHMESLIGNTLIRLAPTNDEAYANTPDQPIGEGQFPSNTPAMKAFKPAIWQIILRRPPLYSQGS